MVNFLVRRGYVQGGYGTDCNCVMREGGNYTKERNQKCGNLLDGTILSRVKTITNNLRSLKDTPLIVDTLHGVIRDNRWDNPCNRHISTTSLCPPLRLYRMSVSLKG